MNRLPPVPGALLPRALLPALTGTLLGALLIGACAAPFGGSRPLETRTLVVHADPGADPDAVAGAVRAAGPRAVFLASPGDADWFDHVAGASRLHLSGPAVMGDLRLAFLGPEPVGDTTHQLAYDGGTLTIQDALYEIRGDRFLDLLAFRIPDDARVRPAIGALLSYVATDVDNAAAVVMAVVVPNAAVADSVTRMLAPAYFDVQRCERASAVAAGDGTQVRLYYGPAARMYCTDAGTEETAFGDWLRAELVMGRR